MAFRTLGLGIAEFVMMGILFDIARDLHISISKAGYLISDYAIGVCVGAPILMLARRHPLKNILLTLGFAPSSIIPLMMLAGFGMVVGNLIGGRLSDRYTPGRVAAFSQGMICLALLLIFFLSPIPWVSVILMCVCTAGLFAVGSPQQILLICYSKGGKMLGAASAQVAFNMGNAIGAYAGGLSLQAGMGYQYPALVGAAVRPNRSYSVIPVLPEIRTSGTPSINPVRHKNRVNAKGIYTITGYIVSSLR